MKLRLVAAAAAFVSLSAAAFQNEPSGFRGIAWGTPLSEINEEFTLSSPAADTSMYARTSDKLQIGDAVLDSLNYIFWDGRLSAVSMSTSGISQRGSLILAFQAQFGPGTRNNPYLHDYVWFGRVARIGLFCGSSSKCTAVLQSQRMLAEENAAKKAAAEKAKRDF